MSMSLEAKVANTSPEASTFRSLLPRLELVCCSYGFIRDVNAKQKPSTLSGYFQKIFNHAPGKCHQLQLIENGSEDIQLLPNGLAFISSGFWLGDFEEYTRRRGRIFLFDFSRPNDPPQELVIIHAAVENFKLYSPHGLNVWTDPKTGVVYLYVISHHPAEIIDKFKFDEDSKLLIHQRRIQDPNFQVLNDLAVIAEDQFYFTNYFYWSARLEGYLRLRWGRLCFYNGTHSTVLQSGLTVPNGVILSADKRHLYMAHCGANELKTYKRLENNDLELVHTLNVQTCLDNVDVDVNTGDIWSGAHVAFIHIMRHLEDPLKFKTAPSQVLRMPVNSDGLPTGVVEEVYSNTGEELSGSTIAVRYRDGLLIGSVIDGALYCNLGSSTN